jgi:ubiquitin C-terminal hydrolase
MDKVVKACLAVEPFAKRQKMFEVLALRVGSGDAQLVALLCQELAHPTRDNAPLVQSLLQRLPADLCRAFLEGQSDAAYLWCWAVLGVAPPVHMRAPPATDKHWPAWVATGHARATWSDALQWLSVGADLVLDNQANFDRSFTVARETLLRGLDDSGDAAVFGCLKVVFQLLTSGSRSCPGLALALLAPKVEAALVTACAGAAESSNEIQMATLMELVSQMPMRPGVCKWFGALYEELKNKGAREALYRVTFEGALANLVLQLFVPSCRRGALEMVSLLLYGFQSSPAAFHQCLPALRHVLQYLQAEKDAAFEVSGAERNPDVSGLFCVTTVLRSLDAAPAFDALSPMTDVHTFGRADIMPQLAVLLNDLMSFHSGFLDYYAPVMEAIRPHLSDPDYMPDLEAIRAKSWTGGSEDDASHSLHHSSSSSSSTSASLAGGRSGSGAARLVARAPGMGVGLANLGNTCYANSLVQALSHCAGFRDAVATCGAAQNKPVCRELSRVFASLASSRHSFAPRELLKVLPEQYRVGVQQDVAEFGKQLLDLTEREVGSELSGAFFTGKLCSTVRCCECGTKSERYEPFSDLSLSFPPGESGANAPSLRLEEMAEYAFGREERMTGDNRYNCTSCGRLADATLSVSVAAVPARYLMITLCRFRYEQGHSSKIFRNVKFGETTSVRQQDGSVAKFRLIAVVFHSGTSVSYGHYYAFARGEKADDAWQLFNDEMVQRATFAQIESTSATFPRETAYLLLYSRVLD